MNRDRIKVFKEKLDNLTISDYHGLHSPGFTCYLNSVLQVLFMTENFRDAIKSCSENSTTIDRHLKRLFADLEKSTAQTHNITRKLGITDVYKQCDAAEYFQKILSLTSPEVSEIFKGELNHKLTCLCCKKSHDQKSFFWILPIVVEGSHHQTYSMVNGFNVFFKREKMCGDKIFCNWCQKKQEVEFVCEITQNPQILTLLLKRFSFDHRRKCYVKLNCKVDVPQTLHIKCRYELYALVNHFGNLTRGHYTADIKSFETGEWYNFNDQIVEMVKDSFFGSGNSSVRSQTAYLLMYRKVFRNADKSTQETQSTRSDVEVGRRERRDSSSSSLACCSDRGKT
ncbi:ubiquitin carboxyl-terminal hydrolase 47-like isoform X2 [Mastacembelus armatus]|uniref:ubiquitin carboxyl-terminal hydrolase 47-like isoform X2 n=1 Tax=Mastacembelus armatus TaxID=205130 RepID=UPI000E45EED0|nr:ubiquitin carboxyl-terminal hydrolase 47-like isoform X2 [Mastacembelus armatus]